jgi:hypothetical protein
MQNAKQAMQNAKPGDKIPARDVLHFAFCILRFAFPLSPI